MIVSFSGIDCAGKSTQIALLEAALVRRGRGAKVLWFRPGYSPELDALRRVVRRFLPRALPPPGQSAARDRAFAAPGVSRTWLAVAALDTWWHYVVKVRAVALTTNTVILDRFVDDALLDLDFRFPGAGVLRAWWTRPLARLAAEPRARFMLTLPPDVMLSRMTAKNEPFPDTDAVRDRRYAAYVQLAATGRFRVVDANRGREDVHREIAGAVLED